jgi:hypothetical protein
MGCQRRSTDLNASASWVVFETKAWHLGPNCEVVVSVRLPWAICLAAVIGGTGCDGFSGTSHLEGYCYVQAYNRYELCPDAGVDAGPQDLGVPDSGVHPDAMPSDVGVPDSGNHPDATPIDMGTPDTGISPDADLSDLGEPDFGIWRDAEPVDMGPPDAGVWPDAAPVDTGIWPDAGLIDMGVPDVGPIVFNGQPADLVLGQPNFTSTTRNSAGVQQPASLSWPSSCVANNDQLFISHQPYISQSSVLRWNSPPIFSGTASDAVFGTGSQASQTGPGSVGEISYIDGGLWVLDTGGSRVVAWDPLPVPTGQPPPFTVLVGQSSWTDDEPGVGPSRFDEPGSFLLTSNRLFVGDNGNHRVLIWNTRPSGVGLQPADVVLGQPNLQSSTPPVPTAASIYTPGGMTIDSMGRLYVTDPTFNRVLVWNQIPTSNMAAADIVLGQTGFGGQLDNAGAPSINSIGMRSPGAIVFAHEHLFVSDNSNSRIMIWRSSSIATAAPADYVLGATSLASPSSAVPGAATLSSASGLCLQGHYLWVVQSSWNRASRFSLNIP